MCKWIGALIVSLLLVAPDALAGTVWEIDGVVEILGLPAGDIPTLETLGVREGAPFRIVVEFDPVEDSDPSSANASYSFPFTYASLTIGDLAYPFDAAAPVGANSISHSVHAGVAEYFMSIPLANATSSIFRFAILTLYDSDLSVLDGESFLTTPPSLDGLDPFDLAAAAANHSTTQLVLLGNAEGSAFSVKGSLSTITAIPEPSTLVLIFLGTIGLCSRRRPSGPFSDRSVIAAPSG